MCMIARWFNLGTRGESGAAEDASAIVLLGFFKVNSLLFIIFR